MMTNKKEAGWNLEQSYHQLPTFFYTETKPTAVQAPKLLVFNQELAKQLGLGVDFLEDKQGEAILAGNTLPEGAVPLAQDRKSTRLNSSNVATSYAVSC